MVSLRSPKRRNASLLTFCSAAVHNRLDQLCQLIRRRQVLRASTDSICHVACHSLAQITFGSGRNILCSDVDAVLDDDFASPPPFIVEGVGTFKAAVRPWSHHADDNRPAFLAALNGLKITCQISAGKGQLCIVLKQGLELPLTFTLLIVAAIFAKQNSPRICNSQFALVHDIGFGVVSIFLSDFKSASGHFFAI